MSEGKTRGSNDLSAKEIAIYLAVIILAVVGIALNVAPVGVFSGLAAGAIVAIHFFLKARRQPPNSD